MEIGSANSDIMERKSISVDSPIILSPTLRNKIENEADIVHMNKVISQNNKNFFLKMKIFPINVYEGSTNVSLRIWEKEGLGKQYFILKKLIFF